MTPLRIVFAGTPAFGLPCLEMLAASTHHIEAIYTQPDRPAGRGRKLQASAVKVWAEAHHIPVYQPLHFKDPKRVEELAALNPDVLVVIAYGLILPRSVLGTPRLGCINVHASSLPRWRGASPIQHAILSGDKQTGITIMQMDIGMDTGDILSQITCDIKPSDTAETLHDRLAAMAGAPLLATLNALASGHTHAEQQDSALATYAPKIKKEDAAINWHQSAAIIAQQIRAFNPWPISYTHISKLVFRVHQARIVPMPVATSPGTILSIDKHGILISTAQDAILVETLQFPGGKAMSVADYLNAGRECLQANMVLGITA
jgi:methionyl-tRNA formyltransferase